MDLGFKKGTSRLYNKTIQYIQPALCHNKFGSNNILLYNAYYITITIIQKIKAQLYKWNSEGSLKTFS